MNKLQFFIIVTGYILSYNAFGQQLFLDTMYTDMGNYYTLKDMSFSSDSSNIGMAVLNSTGTIELNEVNFFGKQTNTLTIGRTDCNSWMYNVNSITSLNGNYWLGCSANSSCFNVQGGFVAKVEEMNFNDSIYSIPNSEVVTYINLGAENNLFLIGQNRFSNKTYGYDVDSIGYLTKVMESSFIPIRPSVFCYKSLYFQRADSSLTIENSRLGLIDSSYNVITYDSSYIYNPPLDYAERFTPVMVTNKCNINRYYYEVNDIVVIDTIGVIRQRLNSGISPFGIVNNAVQTNESVYLGLFTSHKNFAVQLVEIYEDQIQLSHLKTYDGYQVINEGSKMLVKDDSLFIAFNAKDTLSGKEGIHLLGIKLENFLNVDKVNRLNNKLVIYPNPANSTLYVNFNQQQQATISLYSLTGALVLQKQVNATEAQLDVSSLPVGVYVLEAQTKNGIETQKFTKQ